MRQAEWRQETRLMRFEAADEGGTECRLTRAEAARLRGSRAGRIDRQTPVAGSALQSAGG